MGLEFEGDTKIVSTALKVKAIKLALRPRPCFEDYIAGSLLQELVRRGIPQPFRGIAWQLLCGVDLHCVEKRTYATYLKKTSAFEKTISRDITRTFPGHDLFKDKNGIGQESLFNVMKVCCLGLCVGFDGINLFSASKHRKRLMCP